MKFYVRSDVVSIFVNDME